ncbi:hypothetical protein [Micromonospora sp. CPCC 206061]|uniref:hypothetical protein n=1 Tax=Micromonospora sp. CPCC 206061 TaxID=3122410 RepID=UPI002FF13539
MSEPVRDGTSRRAWLVKARQSRRPSRLGTAAGVAPKPDRVFAADAGFPGLLATVWERAMAAPTPLAAVDTLLTLDGHVPADVQLRALRREEECAVAALFGRSWRDETDASTDAEPVGQPAFLGEIGLTTGGRMVLRVPSQRPLTHEEQLVDGVLRVPWSASALAGYRERLARATEKTAQSVADCRDWLTQAGQPGRDRLLGELKEAALRTAPFVLYQDDKRYTNFRERNNLTGKTLWPGHPDCALSSLEGMPLDLWSDSDAVMVVCLSLLIRSSGYARIEEANGTQLTLDHVAELLERTRRRYNAASGGEPVLPAEGARVAPLDRLAADLRRRRAEIAPSAQLYREIHGPLMHKIERIAAPASRAAAAREAAMTAWLCEHLPVTGRTMVELADSVAAAPDWLARPTGTFPTGIEALICETVQAALLAFEADFAMSRGMRSIPALTRALRDEDWATITAWDLPQFFCCVLAAPQASQYFGDSTGTLADIAWSMAARMQYNSWHFIAGNLPKVPTVVARDYFVPPVIPDIAHHSDQHHHGHVAARVRYSIRSPQPVEILNRVFAGFTDLRLLRCDGQPFTEQDLLAAHRASGFVARATGSLARLVQAGVDVEITAFDPGWHWERISGRPSA